MKTIAILFSVVAIPVIFKIGLVNSIPKLDEVKTPITVRQEYLEMK